MKRSINEDPELVRFQRELIADMYVSRDRPDNSVIVMRCVDTGRPMNVKDVFNRQAMMWQILAEHEAKGVRV